jgi:hypothetical protein
MHHRSFIISSSSETIALIDHISCLGLSRVNKGHHSMIQEPLSEKCLNPFLAMVAAITVEVLDTGKFEFEYFAIFSKNLLAY